MDRRSQQPLPSWSCTAPCLIHHTSYHLLPCTITIPCANLFIVEYECIILLSTPSISNMNQWQKINRKNLRTLEWANMEPLFDNKMVHYLSLGYGKEVAATFAMASTHLYVSTLKLELFNKGEPITGMDDTMLLIMKFLTPFWAMILSC